MKVKDSQLQRIRQLYKKIAEGKKVQSDFDSKLTGESSSIGKAETPEGPGKDVPTTNYGDIHQAIERRKYEFAVRAVADAPDIRAEKVADIEARIKAGTYSVDPESVAEAMLGTGLFDDI